MLTRFAVKKGGLTAFRRLRGREYKGLLVEPMECVLFRKQGHNPCKLGARWDKGVWFGKKSDTDEHIIGTPLGQVLARTFARRPDSRRWQFELLSPVVCTPWEPKASLIPTAPVPRQRYLTRAIIERLGRIADCSACAGAGSVHSADCRQRLEALLKAEEEQRATRLDDPPAETNPPAASSAAAASSFAAPAGTSTQTPTTGPVDVDMSRARSSGSALRLPVSRGALDSSMTPSAPAASSASSPFRRSRSAADLADSRPFEISAGDPMITAAAFSALPDSKRQRTLGGVGICMIALGVCRGDGELGHRSHLRPH